MRFFSTVLAGAAFVAAAFAVEINDFPATAEVGKSYTITYSPANNAPTTFILRKGENDDLTNITTLTTTATGGSYTWNVDRALPNGKDYALQVVQNGESNYIGPIEIKGSSSTASASASSSASASASASTSKSSDSTLSTITSASASASSSVSGNSTISVPTLSRSASAGSSSTARATGSGSPTTAAGGAPSNTGAASTLGSSPLALIFGAVAAMAYLN
ncbi:hypothetical protein K469DRAFT_630149 [Zopfia rhizophila CBS 207.26]|uniref:Yeast cell wall synthesis Kre9/Knh1-like N-terminal domain-containing protein n=1 Tax=Zopfia rhizophila CBS 207.26 TaxID=1314779 RepID=A0A6A6E9F9_9PEZI|nr:hypothetical protein K469DRAFT_630149 [Zopfia rhizophila CBS 207.26]